MTPVSNTAWGSQPLSTWWPSTFRVDVFRLVFPHQISSCPWNTWYPHELIHCSFRSFVLFSLSNSLLLTHPSRLYWFPKSAITNHKLGGLKQQKFFLSQFWRPEVQNQGVGRIGSFWRLWGGFSSVPLSQLWGGWQSLAFLALSLRSPPPSSRGLLLIFPPLKSPFSLFYMDTSHWI